jgi:hypothetical protein
LIIPLYLPVIKGGIMFYLPIIKGDQEGLKKLSNIEGAFDE